MRIWLSFTGIFNFPNSVERFSFDSGIGIVFDGIFGVRSKYPFSSNGFLFTACHKMGTCPSRSARWRAHTKVLSKNSMIHLIDSIRCSQGRNFEINWEHQTFNIIQGRKSRFQSTNPTLHCLQQGRVMRPLLSNAGPINWHAHS